MLHIPLSCINNQNWVLFDYSVNLQMTTVVRLHFTAEIRFSKVFPSVIWWHFWGHKTFFTGFRLCFEQPDTYRCTVPCLYLLQLICYMVLRGHSSQLSSHLHFGQTRDCGKMRSAKDQQEPPLPSPGIEGQQKGHQTKSGPSVSQWLLSLLPSWAP